MNSPMEKYYPVSEPRERWSDAGKVHRITLLMAFRRGVYDSFLCLWSSPGWKDFEDYVSVGKKTQTPISILALRRSFQPRSQLSTGKPATSQKSLILRRLVQSVLLNLGCILLLHWVLYPAIHWITRNVLWWQAAHSSLVTTLLRIGCVMPVFFVTRILNVFWFQDIAQAVLLSRRVGPKLFSQSYSSYLADFFMSTLVEFLFLLQTCLVGLLPIPVVNRILGIVHMSLVYSLYAFEYLWVNQGVTLVTRIRVIERHWPYFLGFGLCLSLLTSSIPSIFISSFVFGIFFPVLILSSFLAKPSSARNWMPINVFAPSLSICRFISSLLFRLCDR